MEKRDIFLDTQDYKVFLKYLKDYLSPLKDKKRPSKTFSLRGSTFKGIPRQTKNYNKKVELLAYCLMSNHFHLLIKQNKKEVMKNFMQSLATRYSMYFNKRYDRVGSLFQGNYKAVLITEDQYLLHLSRYIHLNPSEYTSNLLKAYSSYAEYLGKRKTKWIITNPILAFFSQSKIQELKKNNSYKDFVEKHKKNNSESLENFILEEL
ncbi:MAG: transposase [Patescibacteria group bacterium]